MRQASIKQLGYAVIALSLVGFVLLSDWIAGSIGDTGTIRREARQFRSEAADLITSTRNIVPNIQHSYRPSDRLESDGLSPSEPRSFRSGPDGTILNPSPRANNRFTILFLGGSTTESNEVDEKLRFPAVVERELNGANVSAATLNAGVRGHTTLDAINTLLNRPSLRRADVVVLMENINDRLTLAVRDNYEALLGSASPTSLGAIKGAWRSAVEATWDFLSYRSNLLFQLRNIGGRFNAWTGEQQSVAVTEKTINVGGVPSERHRRLYKDNLRLFVANVRALGKEPVLMTQALGISSPAQNAFNDTLRAVADETGTALIDLQRELGENARWAFLSDNIHLNNRGGQAVGTIIARVLAPRLKPTVEIPTSADVTEIEALVNRCEPPDDRQPRSGKSHLLINSEGRYPSFSSDGVWLLYQSWNNGLGRIHAVSTKNGRKIDLTPSNVRVTERHPAFVSVKKNSFEVVFGVGYSDEPNSAELERLFIRSWPSGRTRALPLAAGIGGAIPAVAGNAVLFPGFGKDGEKRVPDLYRLKDNHLLRLTATPWEEWRPAVAKNGDVYFISNEARQFDIYRISAGKTSPSKFFGSSKDEWDPAVSPDGRWIAFASRVTDEWEIYIASTSNSSVFIRLTDGRGEKWDPAWHPSGKFLAYAKSENGKTRIYGACLFGEKRTQ